MTLRIDRQVTAKENVIMLHGWLRSNVIAELEKAAALDALPLRIDLEHLVGADPDGLRALLKLEEQGARLTGASPYIELLLNRTVGLAGGV
jgi:hypothetical protein